LREQFIQIFFGGAVRQISYEQLCFHLISRNGQWILREPSTVRLSFVTDGDQGKTINFA
jgi:hypothetical protein